LRLGPRRRRDILDLPIGHGWQAGERVSQISMGINAAPAAAFDDRVKDGPALARSRVSDEEPVLFAKSRGTNGVLYPEMVIMPRGVPEAGLSPGRASAEKRKTRHNWIAAEAAPRAFFASIECGRCLIK
jgi:hypothetical protein